MKPNLLVTALTLIAPLAAGAQESSSAEVYGLMDAGVVVEQGCKSDCARTKVDSGIPDPVWESVHWNALLPGRSQIRTRLRCAPSGSRQQLQQTSRWWWPEAARPSPIRRRGSASSVAPRYGRRARAEPGRATVLFVQRQ